MLKFGDVKNIETLGIRISNFCISIGLLKDRDRVIPLGSGTLVCVGNIYGVLSAAHVLDELPNSGDIALVRYTHGSYQIQRHTLEMAHSERILFYEKNNAKCGPDLGFISLPPKNISNFKATNAFYNLNLSRDQPPPRQGYKLIYTDQIPGLIGEWSQDEPLELENGRLKRFEGLVVPGQIDGETIQSGYDLVTFDIMEEERDRVPSRYKGVSGGGLWRAYGYVDANNVYTFAGAELKGVAFYQRFHPPQITCHGMSGVHRHIVNRIRELWPEASRSDN